MRRIAIIVTVLFSLALQAQDYARLSERTIMGTARYVGMSGAMSAIGGDPSAAHDNMAGLGLYRRSEALLTFDLTHSRTLQTGTTDLQKRFSFMIPQASFVLCLPSYNVDSKIQFHNILFSYRRLHSYNRFLSGVGGGDPSLGVLLQNADVNWDIPFNIDRYNDLHGLTLREMGAANEFDMGWAMNIANQWYVGLGLNVQVFSFSSDAEFRETFGTRYNNNKSALLYSGTSVSMSAGVIYRPTGWLRLGFGVQTPSVGSLNMYSSGILTSLTDSVRSSTAPDLSMRDANYHMPLHLSSSVAFQIGAYGMIALQYDYLNNTVSDAMHSLRAGLEVIPVLGFYINAGYAYESTFKKNPASVPMDPTFERQDTYFIHPLPTQYVSCAVGYRGTHMIIQAAYQYRWQHLNLYAYETANPYDMNTQTHRVVVTLGWHH